VDFGHPVVLKVMGSLNIVTEVWLMLKLIEGSLNAEMTFVKVPVAPSSVTIVT